MDPRRLLIPEYAVLIMSLAVRFVVVPSRTHRDVIVVLGTRTSVTIVTIAPNSTVSSYAVLFATDSRDRKNFRGINAASGGFVWTSLLRFRVATAVLDPEWRDKTSAVDAAERREATAPPPPSPTHDQWTVWYYVFVCVRDWHVRHEAYAFLLWTQEYTGKTLRPYCRLSSTTLNGTLARRSVSSENRHFGFYQQTRLNRSQRGPKLSLGRRRYVLPN